MTTTKKYEHDVPNPTVRVLARLIRQLLAAERFEALADLSDAVKFRCARLQIRFTNDELNGAYMLIGSNTPLVFDPHIPAKTLPPEEPAPIPEIPKEDARQRVNDLLQEARQRFGTPAPAKVIHRMRPPRYVVPRRIADIQKALGMVTEEIEASVKRCEELEKEEP